LFLLSLLSSSSKINQVIIIFLVIFVDVLCFLDYMSTRLRWHNTEHVKIKLSPCRHFSILLGPPHLVNISVLSLFLFDLLNSSLLTTHIGRFLSSSFLLLLHFLRIFLFSSIIILECPLGAFHVIQMLKTLIINSQLKLVAMLDDVQLMTTDFKRVLERGPEFLHLENASAVSKNLFLATQIAAHEFDCH